MRPGDEFYVARGLIPEMYYEWPTQQYGTLRCGGGDGEAGGQREAGGGEVRGDVALGDELIRLELGHALDERGC